jgi:hypothetical protein
VSPCQIELIQMVLYHNLRLILGGSRVWSKTFLTSSSD